MATVISSCINESDVLEPELLDLILSPLLPAAKADNPAAYRLIGSVLRRIPIEKQNEICEFVNHVLVGSSSNKGEGSELGDHICPLIYEIHKIAPTLLLRILPNVCVQLQAEEESVRLQTVKLLGRLFSSQQAEYGTEFTRNFRDFLNRFNDVAESIRHEMVESCFNIMKKKPSLRSNVEGNIFV